MLEAVSFSREVAIARADQGSDFDLFLRQFAKNNYGPAAALSDDGYGQERQ